MTRRDHSAPTPDATTVVERIRYLMYQRHMNQSRLAEQLGMNSGNLSRILNGKLPLSEGLINRVVADMGVSKRWLRDGVGLPYDKELHARELPLPPAATRAGTPVYELEVTAGRVPLAQALAQEGPVGYVSLPGVGGEGCIVRVAGDSMVPTIRNGSFVQIHQVQDLGIIFWGQIYVVQLDDYRMVKFLRRHQDPAKVVLHSDNPHYDDMEISRSDIRQLYVVDAIFNVDVRC